MQWSGLVGNLLRWRHSGSQFLSIALFYHPLKYAFLPFHGQYIPDADHRLEKREGKQAFPHKQERQKLLKTFPLTVFWWEHISWPHYWLLQAAVLPVMLRTLLLVNAAPWLLPVVFIFPFPLLGVHGELGPFIGFQSEKLMETVEVESTRLNNQLRRVGFRFHKWVRAVFAFCVCITSLSMHLPGLSRLLKWQDFFLLKAE